MLVYAASQTANALDFRSAKAARTGLFDDFSVETFSSKLTVKNSLQMVTIRKRMVVAESETARDRPNDARGLGGGCVTPGWQLLMRPTRAYIKIVR